jgi:hypothetical protein
MTAGARLEPLDAVAQVAAALGGDLDLLRAYPYDPNEPFWRAADEHHVDLLLVDEARAGGADRVWPAEAQRRARSAAVDASAMRSLRDRELRRVLDVLAAAGARCLVIKGAALAHTLYRQPHARRRSDADLLVGVDDVDRVTGVLEALGYARAPEILGEYATSQMHFDRPDCPDHRYALDIHWRLVNAHAFADAIPFEDFEASCVPVPWLGAHAWTLCAPHALALACIHRVGHHPNSDHLLWLWDVHLLASALRDDEIALFAEVASCTATRAVCAQTLDAAARSFGTPAAAALIDRVRPRPGDTKEASARFLRGGLSQADILRSDLASLGWRHGVSLLREHLFPPVTYMRSLYDRWPSVLLPAAYLHRIVCGAPKWLRRP